VAECFPLHFRNDVLFYEVNHIISTNHWLPLFFIHQSLITITTIFYLIHQSLITTIFIHQSLISSIFHVTGFRPMNSTLVEEARRRMTKFKCACTHHYCITGKDYCESTEDVGVCICISLLLFYTEE
jgi:hypothetical protein